MEKFLCLILTVMLFPVGLQANCLTDLSTNTAFSSCLQGLVEALQKVDMQDPSQMCKGDFKKHMLCLSEFIKQCPALSDEGNVLRNIKPVIDQFDTVCSSACLGFNQCNQRVQTLAASPDMQPSGNSTPFSLVPYIVYSLCSVYKEQKKCLNGYRSSCPEAVQSAEQAMDRSLQEDKTVNMDMQTMEEMVSDMCPKIPAGFTSNKCVRQKLESQEFVSCMLDVKKVSAKVPKDQQCRFYYDGLACIEENIGKPCGQENAKAIENSAHLVIHDLPENCDRRIHGVTKSENERNKMVNDQPEAGSESARSSFYLLLVILFVFALHNL